ncbi:MAG: flagellar motor protein MotB [Gammaproteobacteria bacterium]|nr:flagellar motor protein MotB [Gammaproteobacteria bacterium]
MEDTSVQPIVIKKINKHAGHHGGAWKVAFADFAVAMMAFFLLMWLLGSTTAEQQKSISNYFINPIATPSAGGAGIGDGAGSSSSMIQMGGDAVSSLGKGDNLNEKFDDGESDEDLMRDLENMHLSELMDEMLSAIENNETLNPYKEQLLIDLVSEGLRIQVIDKKNRPMFASGDATLKSYSMEIMKNLAVMINKGPNKISITGHTDAIPFSSRRRDYSNWELSAERATSARRALIEGGLNPDKVAQVVGFASSVLFDAENPYSPKNRRISIIVLTHDAEEAIKNRAAGVTQ